MTTASERALVEKARRGEAITLLDHITTIDNLDELEAFRIGARDAGRLTTDVLQAISRREAQINRNVRPRRHPSP